jgi:pimeloyl-ACP methyl ester carboxylesterase
VDFQEPWRVEARAALARHDTVGVAQAWAHSDYLGPASHNPVLSARLATLLGDNVAYWKGLLVDRQTWDTDPTPPAIARLSEIHAPTLLIVGTADVADIHHIVDTLATRVAGLTIVRLPNVGHLPNMERPDSFLSIIQSFLATP